jgi:hypothetical protein
MRRPRPESPLSEAAREMRVATRLLGVLAAVTLLGVIAAAKGWILSTLGPPLLGLFVASSLTAVWFGVKAHRRALADRETESGRSMLVAIAAQLGRQDDAALERIRAKGGPAGEAAGMILQGRAEKAGETVRSRE